MKKMCKKGLKGQKADCKEKCIYICKKCSAKSDNKKELCKPKERK